MDVFYTTKPVKSADFLLLILTRCGVIAPKILRTPNGKPYLDGDALYFNVTHTEGLTAVAVCGQEVGLDAERRTERRSGALKARLTPLEREEDFFELWTAKEAYVKFRGETLARMLPSLTYERKSLFLNSHPIPAFFKHFQLGEHTLCVCTEREETITLISI